MLGSNPGPLQLVRWQSDALTTGLDLIRKINTCTYFSGISAGDQRRQRSLGAERITPGLRTGKDLPRVSGPAFTTSVWYAVFYMVWHVLKQRVRHDMSLAGVWYVQVPRESENCVTCSGNLRVLHVYDTSRCPEYMTCVWYVQVESDMYLTCSGTQRVWHLCDIFRQSLTRVWHFQQKNYLRLKVPSHQIRSV